MIRRWRGRCHHQIVMIYPAMLVLSERNKIDRVGVPADREASRMDALRADYNDGMSIRPAALRFQVCLDSGDT